MNNITKVQDSLAHFINRFTIRSILFIGFTMVIILGLITVLLTEWTVHVADQAMDRFVSVDNRISDFCLKSITAMTNARRHEKDFLLAYGEFGFHEARSRYITRILTGLSDVRGYMKSIRNLTNDPEVVRETQEVGNAVDRYQIILVSMVEKYYALGSLDTGLLGNMRSKADEMETLVKQHGKNLLFSDLLLMRKWEKDFIGRNRDIDAAHFFKAAKQFTIDLAASEVPAQQKEELRVLAGVYLTLFEQYVLAFEEIRTNKKNLLKSVQTIEPILERLYSKSLARVTASREHIKRTEKTTNTIKAVIGPLVLIFSLLVAVVVSGSISNSVTAIKSFAGQLASSDLTRRMTPEGKNEFTALATDLNSMAEALQQADTAQKEWTAELGKSEQRFRAIFENATDGILLSDPETEKIYDGNKMIAQMLGYSLEEMRNLGVMDIYSEKNLDHVVEQFEKQAKREIKTARDLLLKRKDGTVFYADVNVSMITLSGKTYVMGIFRDITERKQSESQIRFLAYYDGLTGLPNRTFFKELLKKALAYARRYNLIAAVLYLDLDDFKRINDTLGHETGDSLLQAVAERLSSALRQSDNVARPTTEGPPVVSRLGGDEFIVLLQHISIIHDAGKVAHRILNEISRPFELDRQEVFVTASVGISLYPEGGDNIEELLKNADAAMYHAKTKGKNNYQYYSEAMNAASLELLTLEGKLHKALERNELLVYYQPKMDLETREITGMEALVRWKPPEADLILPSRFIPLAETSGLIMPIGKFVLHTACLQNKMWQEAGIKPMNVAVNLSGRQFDQKNLIEEVYGTLENTGLNPQCLELEITESTVMRNPEKAIQTLQELKSAGIRIAVDDFGTGYSSLSYLKRLPLDAVKIDISFIRNVVTNPSDAAIVKTIIAMAHSLNLKTIAEGVENEQQLAFLQEHGCDVMQGFLLSPPLPAEEFLELLTTRKKSSFSGVV